MGYVILGMLVLAPQTLYGLHKQFQRSASLFYSASLGGLRSALGTLLARGHVTVAEHVDNGRNKKTYTITEDGRADFFCWLRGPIEAGANLEVVALSKVFFLGLLHAAERGGVVADVRGAVVAELGKLEELEVSLAQTQVPDVYADVFRFQTRTLDYGLVAHRAAVTWFDQLARDIAADIDGSTPSERQSARS